MSLAAQGGVEIIVLDDDPLVSPSRNTRVQATDGGTRPGRRRHDDKNASRNGPTIDLTDGSGSSPSHIEPDRTSKASQPSKKKKFCIECIICLDPIKQPCSTKCGHIFCEPCIKQWLHEKDRCPSCRKKTNAKDLRSIYLLPLCDDSAGGASLP